ncbi:MAG: hypothetical protein ACI8Y7_001065 [Candidatus Woesearchaeota archaeon]|jgi:hypothetical protein
MSNNVQLSDLLMMQMVGGLEEFVAMASSGKSTEMFVSSVRDQCTMPGLFQTIQNHAIGRQFSDRTISLRELGQNARDAYESGDGPFKIAFYYERKAGEVSIRVRDKGVGMSAEGLFTDLLIPFNSGKEFDPKKIGEHGIGFLSNLDISKRIDVTTGKINQRSKVSLQKAGDNWDVSSKFTDGTYMGANIKLILNQYMSKDEVQRTLAQHLGFLDSKYELTLNRARINILPELYSHEGSALFSQGDVTDDVNIHMADPSLKDHRKLKNKYVPPRLVMTQAGLHINEPSSERMITDKFTQELVDSSRDKGYHFWIDLPMGVRLTKGRNDIIGTDMEPLQRAVTTAASEAVLSRLVSDEQYALQMDNVVGDMVERILVNKAKTEKRPLRRVRNALKNTWHFLCDTPVSLPSISFRGLSPGHADSTINEPDTKSKYNNIETYVASLGFSHGIMTAKFIPGVLVTDAQIEKRKVSLTEIIDEELNGRVEDERLLYSPPSDGLYVDTSRKVVYHVLEKVRQERFEVSSKPSLSDLFKELRESLRGGFGSFFKKAKETTVTLGRQDLFDFFASDSDSFPRTKRSSFEKMYKKYGAGEVYLRFFDVLENLDTLVSKASNIPKTHMRLFYERGRGLEVAHTTSKVMGFNITNWTVQSYLRSVLDGTFTEENAQSLVELIVHEKAHDYQGFYSARGDHGSSFYTEAKQTLRKNLYDYCADKSIDLREQMNACLTPLDEPLMPEYVCVKDYLTGKADKNKPVK